MRLHLGGHLNWYDVNKRTWLDLSLAGPTRLTACLAELGVPAGEVAIVVVNQQAVTEADPLLADGDVVELFPPLGGG
jgi:sulfur carrier protein ThiS